MIDIELKENWIDAQIDQVIDKLLGLIKEI